MNTNENNNPSNIPENDSSKPMNSKREVEQSPDEKIGEDFRGYPIDSSRKDIMSQETGSHHTDATLENTSAGPNASGVSQRYASGQDQSAQSGGENSSLDGNNEEIGLPHNVTNEDITNNNKVPGTDIEEAAEKGSLNP